MSIANLVRRIGPLPAGKPWRKVHAERARKLRRRGDDVRFVRFNRAGRAVYEWRPAVVVQPYQKRLFEMLADLEREADAMDKGGQDFMELAQARTRPFLKPMVMTTTTPNRTETVEQWAERLWMSGIKSVRECREDERLAKWIDPRKSE